MNTPPLETVATENSPIPLKVGPYTLFTSKPDLGLRVIIHFRSNGEAVKIYGTVTGDHDDDEVIEVKVNDGLSHFALWKYCSPAKLDAYQKYCDHMRTLANQRVKTCALRKRLRQHESLSPEEFAFVKTWDQHHNTIVKERRRRAQRDARVRGGYNTKKK